MSTLFTLPKQVPISSSGNPYPGAKLYFYAAGTTTAQLVYSDVDLTTAHAQPVQADANGRFPAIYLNPNAGANYRVQLYTLGNVLIYDQDDVPATPMDRAGIGGVLYPITDAETSAGLTIADLTMYFEPGDVRRYGATGDGVTDDQSALASAATVGISLVFPIGTYRVASAVTLADVKFKAGASIKPASGITATITGSVESPDQIIFDGSAGGLFDLTDVSSTLRLTQFSGTYANDKMANAVAWFMGSGQANSYSFEVPRPDPNYDATAVQLKNGRYYWACDDTLHITNDCSEGTIYLHGAFFGLTAIGANELVHIGDANKLNNLTIVGDLVAHADSAGTVTDCVFIDAVARLSVVGTINTQYGDYGTTIGGPNLSGNAGAIQIGQLHTFGYRYRGHRISGNGAYSISQLYIGTITSSSPNATRTNVDFGMSIGGGVLHYNIGQYICTTAGASSADPKGALLLEGDSAVTADGGGHKCGEIGQVLGQALDEWLLKVTGDDANANVENVTIHELLSTSAGASPTGDSRDVSIDWASRLSIRSYGDLSQIVTIGANCGRVSIDGVDSNSVTITNTGTKTVINGLGYQYGIVAAAKPSTNWQIGDVVVNDADSPHTLWRKTKHTGTPANDFIQVG